MIFPRFFEVTWQTKYYEEVKANVTDVFMTPMRQHPTYISVYITWLYLVVMYFLPFISLAVFNLLIYFQILNPRSRVPAKMRTRKVINSYKSS